MLEVTNAPALKAFEDRIESLEREKLIALEKAAQKPKPTRPFGEMFELQKVQCFQSIGGLEDVDKGTGAVGGT